MTTTTKSLEQKIESAVAQLVGEHLAACEAAAAGAVRRAFGRASKPTATSSRRRPMRSPTRRRSPEVLADLQERLYQAICQHPGEKMAVIAPVVGATARELNRPATTLRRDGRVRSVGQRHSTRYFPLGE